MKKINKFKLISRLLNNRTNIAAKELADITNEYNKRQKKLSELHTLVLDYKARLNKRNMQIQAEKFQQNHRFIEYLEYITNQQEEVVVSYKNELIKKRQIWIYCHRQNKELKNYLTEVEAEALLNREKKEQKELDAIVTDNYTARIDTSN